MEPGAALGTIKDHVGGPIDVPDGPHHRGADHGRVIHAWSASSCAGARPLRRASVPIFGPTAAWRTIWHEREGQTRRRERHERLAVSGTPRDSGSGTRESGCGVAPGCGTRDSGTKPGN
jgi:hypothetical protein